MTLKPGTNGCVAATGTLHDPYSRKVVDFARGANTSPLVQIDHVVALLDAWQKGAQQWDAQTRQNFANDLSNLQATTPAMNPQKGDGDAATWLPANKDFRCTYVARQIEVKVTYGLWVTQAEHDAMARILTDCGATPATTETVPPADDDSSRTVPAAAEPDYTRPPTVDAPAYTPQPAAVEAPAPASAYYANCAAVRAAGAAPLYVGQPGYSSKLDRDGDGVACE